MRTTAPVVFVLALGVAFAIVGTTGIAATWGLTDTPGGDGVESNLNQSAANSSAGESGNFEGDVGQSGDDTSLLGLTITGISIIASAAGAIVLLPITLTNLGMPAYAAIPLGFFLQVIVGIGIVEFATGRQYT